MRAGVVGLTSVGLGGAAVAVSLLLPPFLDAPAELDPDASFETVSAGEVTYLDPATLTPRTGAEVSTSVRVRGDADAGDADADTVVWLVETTTADADGTLVATGTTTACLDRVGARGTACAVEAVDGRPTEIRGLVLAFPPDTPQRDHEVWDGTVGAPLPARFAGTEELRGLEVHRFEQEVPEQVVGTVTVPGGLVGAGAVPLPAEVVHATSRTLLVEPVSGVVVSAVESPRTRLRGLDGTPGAVLFAGTLASTEESVDEQVARAREVLDRAALTGTVLPWSIGGTGGALVVLGAVLLLVGRRAAPAPQVEDEPARVAVPTA
jgi:hypothetical protein